ncbi:MAG: hydrogenase iron-sulfur subunit [Deltaproteobacteria bacterium]|nr:hydrogenase iron-sulfur subunit [Deltaproteobacteria bacterium]
MSFIPNIQAFCCHYTSQQTCAADGGGLLEDGFPANITINRLACGGKLQVSALLTAFENGADGVYVVGCPPDECHNVMGSQRAAKKVLAVKKALAELEVEPERIEMFHLPRGLSPEFITVGKKMARQIKDLGPCPFNGDNK